MKQRTAVPLLIFLAGCGSPTATEILPERPNWEDTEEVANPEGRSPALFPSDMDPAASQVIPTLSYSGTPFLAAVEGLVQKYNRNRRPGSNPLTVRLAPRALEVSFFDESSEAIKLLGEYVEGQAPDEHYGKDGITIRLQNLSIEKALLFLCQMRGYECEFNGEEHELAVFKRENVWIMRSPVRESVLDEGNFEQLEELVRHKWWNARFRLDRERREVVVLCIGNAPRAKELERLLDLAAEFIEMGLEWEDLFEGGH